MSQVIFTDATTKGQLKDGLNANFTEVYGELSDHAASLASIVTTLSGLGSMATQDAGGVNITNGSAVLSNLTCGNVTITGGSIAGVDADLSSSPPVLPPSAGSSQNPLTDAPAAWVSIKRDGTTYAVPCYASL